jgi:hypothetical protein
MEHDKLGTVAQSFEKGGRFRLGERASQDRTVSKRNRVGSGGLHGDYYNMR